MKPKVYIETSVVSYLTARRSRDLLIAARQETTAELWSTLLSSQFTVYTSTLVHREAQMGDPEQAQRRVEALLPFSVLDVDQEAQTLAGQILAAKTVPAEYPEDALHMAVAAVNGMDVLVTWNFAHLNNPVARAKIRQIIEDHGYRCPEVCSPEELLETGP
ncbi:MAG TPA: type II toxin-antitoxin system VapC family toxin [Sedimentisphaerales bacterium]|jgi:predicted nucleic acid-binding protein|nr:type II toxin-antitoxin system VapC family toxin [Sedimentisphaerales bacterium]HNU30447.1 type II toxin-antitoxin system VapC family toxin [Sedimentisphaerales bacterium]